MDIEASETGPNQTYHFELVVTVPYGSLTEQDCFIIVLELGRSLKELFLVRDYEITYFSRNGGLNRTGETHSSNCS